MFLIEEKPEMDDLKKKIGYKRKTLFKDSHSRQYAKSQFNFLKLEKLKIKCKFFSRL